MMQALEAGADDFSSDDEGYEVLTAPSEFSAVREALEKAGYSFLSAELDMLPQNTVEVDETQEKEVLRLLDMLEDNDDVQNVYHNAEIDE